ncbi:hypothetical protein D3C74_419890 [compost metagenome]
MVQLHVEHYTIRCNPAIRIAGTDQCRSERPRLAVEQQITESRLGDPLRQCHPLQEFQGKVAMFAEYTFQIAKRDNGQFPFFRHLCTVAMIQSADAAEFTDEIAALLNG